MGVGASSVEEVKPAEMEVGADVLEVEIVEAEQIVEEIKPVEEAVELTEEVKPIQEEA